MASVFKDTVRNHLGKDVPLTQSLIAAPGRPAGGWTWAVEVGGQVIPVQGATAAECYSKTVALLSANNIPWTPREVWLNLNLYWLSRTPEKYHLVRERDLNAVAGKPAERPARDPGVRSYTPKEWGSIGWRWLGIWLAQDHYEWSDFAGMLEAVLELLDPVKNPSIGCVECHREFSMAIHNLGRPLHSREEARKWLWEIHNNVSKRIGKPELS